MKSSDNRPTSEGEWQGQKVTLKTEPGWPLCGDGKHHIRQMHHFGSDGHDYGPTGFLECALCTGIAKEPV